MQDFALPICNVNSAQRHILWGLRPQTPGTSRPPASLVMLWPRMWGRRQTNRFFLIFWPPAGQCYTRTACVEKGRFLRKKKTSMRGAAVPRTACFYQVLIDVWSIVPFVGLFMHILNILLKIVENCWNMSFPMFVLSFREIPKAKLMSEVLFTVPDTSQGPKYIGKHHFAWFVY